jgi:hypothetical protein
MNQKNIFTAISVVLILQGLVFFFMGNQLMASAFPASDEACRHLLALLFEVVAALSIAVGLIAYATRTTPGAVWAFTFGTAVLLIVTLKHLLVDGINVPIPAVIIQVLIVLACGYLMMGKKKV